MMLTLTDNESVQARAFYAQAVALLQQEKIPFLIGGAFALFHYTGIRRHTKDLDVFCNAVDYPAILKLFAGQGFETELTDARWLAKVKSPPFYMDLIFDSSNGICTVDDQWFAHAVEAEFEQMQVMLVPPEEIIWSKLFVQNRERYDGADINHLLLKCGSGMNWERLLQRVSRHWQLLLAQLLTFQFTYPSDFTAIVPKELFTELLRRAAEQYELPVSQEKLCMGPLIDQTQYGVDILEWHYKVTTQKSI